MYIKGNPIISRMYALNGGLVLNQFGLYYVNKESTNLFFIVSEDHQKIAEAIGFNYDELEEAKEYEDFFKILYENEYFSPSRFLRDVSDGGSKMLGNLSEYIQKNPVTKKYRKKTLEDFFGSFPDLQYKVVEFENICSQKNKLRPPSGLDILEAFPEFEKTDLNEAFGKFAASFPNQYERLRFVAQNSKENLIKYIVEVFNNFKQPVEA